MFNERGQKITEVRPGEPCSILGLNGAPQAGDDLRFDIEISFKDSQAKKAKAPNDSTEFGRVTSTRPLQWLKA